MTYKIIEMEQGSSIWLEKRKSMITATDSGVILGLNPWKTPLMLWEEKLGLREPQAINSKMREGSLLEDEARDFINKLEENDFKPVVLISNIHSFMMASLDGMDCMEEIIEIKCGEVSLHEAFRGEIPNYYYAQLQKQMFVSGCDSIYYFCYRSPEKRKGITVKRDDAFIEKMIEAEKEFYRMMMDFTPPPATDRDFIHKDSKEWRLHAEVWKDTKKQLKLLEAKEEALRNELIKMCEGQSSQGSGIRVSKTTSKGRINYSAIEELKEIDIEKYRGKNITSFRFTEIKGQNQ